MKKPYKAALPIPLDLSPGLCVKKKTVNGIIGKTQGVSIAIKPPSIPRRKMVKRLLFFEMASPQSTTGLLISIDGIGTLTKDSIPPSSATLNGNSVEG